jgi:ureidoacrylate peracid hydrolase
MSESTGRATRLGHLLLQTNDLAASEAFYVDVLGFKVVRRDVFRDGRPLIVTEQGLGLTSGRPTGDGPVEHIAFEATGVEALAKEAQRRGVSVVSGPEPSAYGISLYLDDPDGNKIEVFGPEEKSA